MFFLSTWLSSSEALHEFIEGAAGDHLPAFLFGPLQLILFGDGTHGGMGGIGGDGDRGASLRGLDAAFHSLFDCGG